MTSIHRGSLMVALCIAGAALGQVRIANWNISNYPSEQAQGGGSRNPSFATALYGVGLNNITFRPDVLIVQEMENASGVTQFLAVLNGAHGSNAWSAAPFDTPAGGCNDTGNALFYRNDKFVLVAAVRAATGGCSPAPPRNIARYDISPIGYGNSLGVISSPGAVLSLYSVHMKSGSGTDDTNRRQQDASRIVADIATLPPSRHYILGGDFNIPTSSEQAYRTLVGPDPFNPTGPLFDPIRTPGSWQNSSAFRFVHTQAPFGSGGMDDRFDQLLCSPNILDVNAMNAGQNPTGFDYFGNPGIPYSTSTWNDPNHSYRSWGNDGSSFNSALNTTSNSFVGNTIAQALVTTAGATGHLPVFMDLRIPPRIAATTVINFGTVHQNSSATQNLTVSNNGDVAAFGAATIASLRYSISSPSGFTAPGGTFTDAAGGGANVHVVSMDTSTLGVKSGTIIISSNAGDFPARTVQLQGEVVAGTCPADLNEDGQVDFNDYLEFLNRYNLNDPSVDFNGDGQVDFNDYLEFLNLYNTPC